MSTSTLPRKLVTIIAPEAHGDSIVGEIAAIGAGASISEVRGVGTHGARPDTWHGANVQIQTVLDEEGAARLLAHLEQRYLPTLAIVAWVVDVAAWPAQKLAR